MGLRSVCSGDLASLPALERICFCSGRGGFPTRSSPSLSCRGSFPVLLFSLGGLVFGLVFKRMAVDCDGREASGGRATRASLLSLLRCQYPFRMSFQVRSRTGRIDIDYSSEPVGNSPSSFCVPCSHTFLPLMLRKLVLRMSTHEFLLFFFSRQ